MRTLRLKNVLYFPHINVCGGIETFCYEMGLKYGKDYDITVLYRNGEQYRLYLVVARYRRASMGRNERGIVFTAYSVRRVQSYQPLALYGNGYYS